MMNEDKFDPSDKIIGGCEKHEEYLDSYDEDFDEGAPYFCMTCDEPRTEDQMHFNEHEELLCDFCGDFIAE
jgi:hypothetical protein